MSEELEKVKDSFTLMDEKDELQIITSEDVQKSLVYKVGDKQMLSITGVKFLFQKYNQQEKTSIIIIDSETYCRLEKDDESNSYTWFWRAKVKLRSTKTLQDGTHITIEEEGLSECEYGKKFARIIAHSKAERNAQRKLIPEFEITNMIEKFLKAGQVENVKPQDNNSETQNTTPAKIDSKYLEILDKLGWDGELPKTNFACAELIKKLKSEVKEAETVDSAEDDYEKYCICDKPIPNSINGKTCQTCKKLLEEKSQ